jgi:hypothetical protein
MAEQYCYNLSATFPYISQAFFAASLMLKKACAPGGRAGFLAVSPAG